MKLRGQILSLDRQKVYNWWENGQVTCFANPDGLEVDIGHGCPDMNHLRRLVSRYEGYPYPELDIQAWRAEKQDNRRRWSSKQMEKLEWEREKKLKMRWVITR